MIFSKKKKPEKERTYQKKVGDFGEEIAVKYLKKQGYKIKGRNVYLGHKEIDILAKIKKKNVFVEVKTLVSDHSGHAEDLLGRLKVEKLRQALDYYLLKNKLDPENVRFDFIAIDIIKEQKIAKIRHYKDVL